MSGWETLNCANHPDRIALERCEVCGKPLCAYCLYYTDDGQRLCAEHAEAARKLGVAVEDPAIYADQLIGAQIGALRKRKRGENAGDEDLYKGNSTDVLSLVGMLIGLITAAACCGAVYCLPVVGLVLSVMAVFGAKKAYDPRRTRRFGLIGMALSGVWVLVIAGCILTYGLSLTTLFRASSVSLQGNLIATLNAHPTDTPTPAPSGSPTPTVTAGPTTAPLSAPFEREGAADRPISGGAPGLAVHWESGRLTR